MESNNRGALRTYLISIISVVFLIALLASAGFYYFESGKDATGAPLNDKVKTFGDSLWWTMVTMTTIGYGDIFPVTVGGRLVAVCLMFIGIGTLGVSTAAIAAYFVKNDQLQLLRVSRLKGHVIICGLGNKGLLLAQAFRQRGQPVIVIEQDETNKLLESCKDQGVILMMGDATDRELLMKARVQTARTLIAVCGNDGANAEVAARARDLISDRKGVSLTCCAHLVDPELWYLLRHWEISTTESFRMQFFNVYDLGARAILAAHPPFLGDKARPHLLIVGAGKLGQNIVMQAARMWRESGEAGEKLLITIIDRNVDHLKESLYLRRPGLDRICEIDTLAMEVPSPQFHRASFLHNAEGKIDITMVYICLDDDGLGLSAALALLHRVRHHQIPIVVQMTRDGGLSTLLQTAQGSTRGFEHLHAVGLLERICQPELVLGGANEALARAIHERYVRDQLSKEGPASQNPALVTWDRLPEDLKESNRSQADHIGLKLHSIGCDIAPLTEWQANPFAFTPEEVETMAKMEHERWIEERLAQGWTLGPRNPEKKTNPNLVPWETLPEEGKAFNRNLIQELPESLSHAGFQIYRLKFL